MAHAGSQEPPCWTRGYIRRGSRSPAGCQWVRRTDTSLLTRRQRPGSKETAKNGSQFT